MRVRGATWLGQLGWMMLGSVAGSTVALSVAVLVGVDDLANAFVWLVVFLAFSFALSVVLTLVPWGGYLLGSAISRRWDGDRESTSLVVGAVAALVVGGAAIVISVAIVDGFGGVYIVPVIGGLAGSVLAVTLARLPLDKRYDRRYVKRERPDWDASGHD
jgi:hypothetical protein